MEGLSEWGLYRKGWAKEEIIIIKKRTNPTGMCRNVRGKILGAPKKDFVMKNLRQGGARQETRFKNLFIRVCSVLLIRYINGEAS